MAARAHGDRTSQTLRKARREADDLARSASEERVFTGLYGRLGAPEDERLRAWFWYRMGGTMTPGRCLPRDTETEDAAAERLEREATAEGSSYRPEFRGAAPEPPKWPGTDL
jgi:hypothetical protein